MKRPNTACPVCGKWRYISPYRHRVSDVCRACRGYREPTDDDALTGGRWTRQGLISRWIPTPPPEHPKPQPATCGTYSGYRHHQNHGEAPCEECRDAARAFWRRQKRAERARIVPRELRPCGTYSAFVRHRRHGEEPCEPCLTAAREYFAKYRRNARQDARRAA